MMVARSTRLHEQTVQAAEQHSGQYRQPRTRKRTPAPAPVTVIQVAHPIVWAEARKLAGGDASRLQIVDYSTVRVLNGPGR